MRFAGEEVDTWLTSGLEARKITSFDYFLIRVTLPEAGSGFPSSLPATLPTPWTDVSVKIAFSQPKMSRQPWCCFEREFLMVRRWKMYQLSYKYVEAGLSGLCKRNFLVSALPDILETFKALPDWSRHIRLIIEACETQSYLRCYTVLVSEVLFSTYFLGVI